jgi:hypothetical protein
MPSTTRVGPERAARRATRGLRKPPALRPPAGNRGYHTRVGWHASGHHELDSDDSIWGHFTWVSVGWFILPSVIRARRWDNTLRTALRAGINQKITLSRREKPHHEGGASYQKGDLIAPFLVVTHLPTGHPSTSGRLLCVPILFREWFPRYDPKLRSTSGR